MRRASGRAVAEARQHSCCGFRSHVCGGADADVLVHRHCRCRQTVQGGQHGLSTAGVRHARARSRHAAGRHGSESGGRTRAGLRNAVLPALTARVAQVGTVQLVDCRHRRMAGRMRWCVRWIGAHRCSRTDGRRDATLPRAAGCRLTDAEACQTRQDPPVQLALRRGQQVLLEGQVMEWAARCRGRKLRTSYRRRRRAKGPHSRSLQAAGPPGC